jgi:thiol-disulfide isomerase/thioredoxin
MKFLVSILMIISISACSDRGAGSSIQDDFNKDITEIGCDIDKTPPSFKCVLSDNTFFELSEHRGKVVLLDFWAVWCPYCNYSRPTLKTIHNEFLDEPDFIMLGISVNDKIEKWQEYIIEKELNWLQTQNSPNLGVDPKTLFCVEGIPTVIILDRWGVIRAKINPTNTDLISQKIKQLLGE